MKSINLRELINKLEEISDNGRNDYLSVMIHSDVYMEKDCFGQDECDEVHGACIDIFNDCGTFDESTESYEFVKIY